MVKIRGKIRNFAPDVVINSTAYTSVDKAEGHSHSLNIINDVAVENIAVI